MNAKIKLSQWIANQKKLPFELEGKIVDETEKAVKVEYVTTVTVWLPKSQITIETTEKQGE